MGTFGRLLCQVGEKTMEIWVKADSKREKKVEFLYKIRDESENLPYLLNVDQAWETLEGNMNQFEESTEFINT